MTDSLTHRHLTAEEVNDDNGPAIMLTQQEGFEDAHVVLVHPWQLRAVCEQFGIIASDPQAAKTIATLQRRMVLLRDRINTLHDYLLNHSDHRHADLSYELTYATACIDLADEFCAEFDGSEPPAAVVGVKPIHPHPAHSPAVAAASQAELI
jgi:hypothetical protein